MTTPFESEATADDVVRRLRPPALGFRISGGDADVDLWPDVWIYAALCHVGATFEGQRWHLPAGAASPEREDLITVADRRAGVCHVAGGAKWFDRWHALHDSSRHDSLREARRFWPASTLLQQLACAYLIVNGWKPR